MESVGNEARPAGLGNIMQRKGLRLGLVIGWVLALLLVNPTASDAAS